MTMAQDVTLLTDGRIYTLDPAAPVVHTMALRDGRILAAGETADQLLDHVAPSHVVSLAGRIVLPGLVDAHIHLEQYALSLTRIDCQGLDLHACLDAVAERAAQIPPVSWILGHGWDHNLWGRYGTRADLDRAAPQHPVFLSAKSLHASWVNSLALEAAGIDGNTPDPDDGRIQRDAAGTPTGILLEGASRLVARHIPHPDHEALVQAIDHAQHRLLRMGLTGVHDFDGPRCLRALQSLKARDALSIRVLANIPLARLQHALALGLQTGFGDEWLRLGNVKVFADGALGPRTAAMIDPYDDQPDNSGALLKSSAELFELAHEAARAGLAMAIHAIGDRANREVLNAFRRLRRLETQQDLPPLRHRIEHVQLLHPEDMGALAELGIIASMQPIHATSDMPMAIPAWGKRTRFAYAWDSLLQHGTHIAFGSDAPVEDPNPFWGIHAAVTRRRHDGSPSAGGWIPQQRLGLNAALYAYTQGPAYAAGLESISGRLQTGYLADLIVLEVDPFRVQPHSLWQIAPVGVMVGGLWRFRSF